MTVFYCPTDGYVGDVIPFFWGGIYHAFYLKAPLPPHRHGADGTPYAHLISRDLVNWEEWPLAIKPGEAGSPDEVSCFTGSVIERNGVFHLFYTGYRGSGQPQTICRATSKDLRHWEKDPHNPLIEADQLWYESVDWRDPFVFWNDEAHEYWMLLAAREKDGPDNRRGCIALITSPDLEHWTIQPPFWSPRLYYTHECPDLFRWNNMWVLVYSTFSERTVTHFRVCKTLAGPWLAPTNDTFDGRAFYAAKTVSDGQRRFVFGWNPTREGENDSGRWEWGGHLVIHEIQQDLSVRPVPEHMARFGPMEKLTFTSLLGHWQQRDDSFQADAPDSFAAATFDSLPDTCYISCQIECGEDTRACGIFIRADDKLEHYYQIRWEPGRQRIVFDRWPRPGDEPFMLERPLAAGSVLQLRVFIENTVIVAYVNDAVALSCRAYARHTGQWGVFVSEGQATFSDAQLFLLSE